MLSTAQTKIDEFFFNETKNDGMEEFQIFSRIVYGCSQLTTSMFSTLLWICVHTEVATVLRGTAYGRMERQDRLAVHFLTDSAARSDRRKSFK